MNAVMRQGIDSGAIEVTGPPPTLKVKREWLEAVIGDEPRLGLRVAIGGVNPAVYDITMGEGPLGVEKSSHFHLRLVTTR